MTAYKGKEVQFYVFFTSAGGDCSATPNHFAPSNRASGTHWLEDWLGACGYREEKYLRDTEYVQPRAQSLITILTELFTGFRTSNLMKHNVSLNRCQDTPPSVCLRCASQSPSFYFRPLTVQTRGTLRLADSAECLGWGTALNVVHNHIPSGNMPSLLALPAPTVHASFQLKYVYK